MSRDDSRPDEQQPTEFSPASDSSSQTQPTEVLGSSPPAAPPPSERTETRRRSRRAAERESAERERIGHYKILQKLGEGGMGVVYMAEQTEPVHRRVALKVIKLGMDTKEVVARFGAERQALAVMDHPSIARVFDAGATERGRPYFVMELVRGIEILEYCDRHNLSTRQRLELFIPVCHAVQHAHQKGVIHRDLKPSNILISDTDEGPLPKIIDFGVAKATGRSLSDRTMFTETGQLLGTPEYMSPEQAEFSGMDIDTRTDIYSLGVVLYELLTGELPVDGKTLRQAGFVEMQRIIREQEPPRPSTRLTSLGARSGEVAKHRRTDPGTLTRQLKGDLDWIVMKALEKDRARRYDTAAGFSQDIERHLNDEPVLARPPSAAYRVRKFVRRNRLGVSMAAALTVALVFGMVGTAVGFVRAKREAAKAQTISSFLQNMLSSVSPDSKGRDVTVRDALDEAAKTVGPSFAGQPEVEAAVSQTVGRMYSHLGYYGEAEPHLVRALELRRRLYGAADPETLETLNLLAINHFKRGRYEDARHIWEEGLPAAERVYGRDHVETLTWKQNVAAVHLGQKRYEQAEPLLVEVVAGRRRVLGPGDPATLSSLNNLAELYRKTERFVEAEPLYVQVLDGRRASLGEEHTRTLNSLFNLADLYRETGRPGRAEPLLQRALEGYRRALGDEHPYTLLAMRTLARVQLDAGRTGPAERLARESFERHQARFGPEHPETVQTIRLLVDVYRAVGDGAQARAWEARLPIEPAPPAGG